MSPIPDPKAVLSSYDAEMRANAPPDAGFELIRGSSLVWMRGPGHHFVLFARPEPGQAAALIEAQLAELRALGGELEWKVYSHDLPGDLGALLAKAGFCPDPPETLMALDLAEPVSPPTVPEGLELRWVHDEAGLQDAVAAAVAAFGHDDGSVRGHAEGRLDDPSVALCVAYLDGVPVSSGRVELPAGRPFASLWGGGTRPEYRNRGIYHALVLCRAQLARDRGFRYLMVDAQDATSRPILERIGFTPLAGIVGWIVRAPGPGRTGPTTPSEREGPTRG
ncbi:MAG TPA: GNAT family N-acetyltransferase [Thermoplasmata archaeon]|nr:GNAT family N-acetyltransferase [Thermoplasmata archaeon]